MTFDLLLIMFGGVLGSSHCVGMCGAFVFTLGLGARGLVHGVFRQLVYGSGRVFTYGFLGLCAGAAGYWLQSKANLLIHAQGIMTTAAGILLVVQGLCALGILRSDFVLRRLRKVGVAASCVSGAFMRTYLTSKRIRDVFIAGMFNGFLPCGLVYGYLALASSTGFALSGGAVMAAFGVGTLPVMVLTGTGATILGLRARHILFRLAAMCVLITGLVAVGRGLWSCGVSDPSHACPACSREALPIWEVNAAEAPRPGVLAK